MSIEYPRAALQTIKGELDACSELTEFVIMWWSEGEHTDHEELLRELIEVLEALPNLLRHSVWKVNNGGSFAQRRTGQSWHDADVVRNEDRPHVCEAWREL